MMIIRNKIREELINSGYNISNKGTIYLIDSIEFLCKQLNYFELLQSLEKNVYIVIAKKYNSNIMTVKSDIIKATNNMYLNQYYYNINKVKPTPKMVIYNVVDKIMNN